MTVKKILLIASFLLPAVSHAQDWQSKKAVLMTRFAKDVDPKHVLPEYPRPQLERAQWLNLNGVWQYQPGTDAGEALPQNNLSGSILVPFPVESALSGVMEHHERLWYRRKFTVPAAWKGQHLLLHFGAVDNESEVFVNGKSMGKHTGGYDPFTYDITPAIKVTGAQEITVKVYDPTDKGGLPRGKQTLNPQGIMYTSTTGIWQTVWLEPVPVININDIHIVPDVDRSMVKITVNSMQTSGYNVFIKIKDGIKVVSTTTGKPNTEIDVPVAKAKLWSPDAPFLYGLDISLVKQGKQIDAVTSYFGMRKISTEFVDGYKKLYLNNKFLFQLGPLDQGFWPDGIYTAPTDAAIKNDLQTIKNLGFNMVRKHIKVEPYRWYYWADKLGLMVWQDMPSANSYTEHTPPVDTAAYTAELNRMVKTHWNQPCIVTWVIFNESQGQFNTPGLVSMVHKLDPSRLINQASGGTHFGVGDFLDIHSYPPPGVPQSKTQVLACGEYGGIGYIIPGHIWKSGPTYIMIDNEKDYVNLYNEYARNLAIYKTNNGLSAAVYTETTDVESELNGLMTYDREVIKGAAEKIRASNTLAINGDLFLTDVLPTSKTKARNWKYTFDKPAANWFSEQYSDAAWQTGPAGFGTVNTPGAVIKTTWNTNDIWLRQEFTFALNNINKNELVLNIHHDDDCEVYINGVKAATLNSYTSDYVVLPISNEAKNAINLNGKNVIAIHCHQITGGQFIDAGISLLNNIKR